MSATSDSVYREHFLTTMAGENMHFDSLFGSYHPAHGRKTALAGMFASICLSVACALTVSIIFQRSINHSAQFSLECRSPDNSLGQLQSHSKDTKLRRESVIVSLRGQTLRIPNMAPLFEHLPRKVHPELERLRIEVKEWLDMYV